MARVARQSESGSRRDLPGCLKYVLLLLLVLLLLGEIAAGEFSKIAEAGWLIWIILLIKLILIAGLIALIRVQRDLKCDLTAPTGCTEEEPDPVAGILFVRVMGTASGAVFGSYTLEIQKDGDPAIAGIVSYPGGGGSGAAPVIGGELGRFNTTSLSDGAYTITMRVHPAGFGSPKACTITFNLLKVIVYMRRSGDRAAEQRQPVRPRRRAAHRLRRGATAVRLPYEVSGRRHDDQGRCLHL